MTTKKQLLQDSTQRLAAHNHNPEAPVDAATLLKREAVRLTGMGHKIGNRMAWAFNLAAAKLDAWQDMASTVRYLPAHLVQEYRHETLRAEKRAEDEQTRADKLQGENLRLVEISKTTIDLLDKANARCKKAEELGRLAFFTLEGQEKRHKAEVEELRAALQREQEESKRLNRLLQSEREESESRLLLATKLNAANNRLKTEIEHIRATRTISMNATHQFSPNYEWHP